ncbi:MAG TPA: hypothetical protein VIN66_02735 [Rheinheimera sp.]|uniref:AbiJ-NTD4 domain-containing protein n=1 Tax=Rheinheimera sp. TaxID=1869214 RepID=UPI002F95EBD1
MKFSQRIGITPPKKLLQKDSIDQELTNSLWNALTSFIWTTFKRTDSGIYGERTDFVLGSNLQDLILAIWILFFKKPTDEMPRYYSDVNGVLSEIREFFFKAHWYEVYDFIEFVSGYLAGRQKELFIKASNSFLERENAAYRFVDGVITEISSKDEIQEIEDAISNSTPYYGVKKHLTTALDLLSDRVNPDYRNSIKESISAVESLCRKISGHDKSTLGDALKVLEKRGAIHPALKTAYNAIYGYTNDADGIRHALLEESNLSSADARFMLISCSAFINYIIAVNAD